MIDFHQYANDALVIRVCQETIIVLHFATLMLNKLIVGTFPTRYHISSVDDYRYYKFDLQCTCIYTTVLFSYFQSYIFVNS